MFSNEETKSGYSINIRGRNDTEPKATLIQLLPYDKKATPVDETKLLKAVLEMFTNEMIKLKVDLITIKKQNEILQNRISNLYKSEANDR